MKCKLNKIQKECCPISFKEHQKSMIKFQRSFPNTDLPVITKEAQEYWDKLIKSTLK